MKKLILLFSLFVFGLSAFAQNVSLSMKASNVGVFATDYTLTNTVARCFTIDARRSYPVVQTLTVTLHKVSGLTAVKVQLYGKLTLTGDSTQIGTDYDWNCTSETDVVHAIENTTATLWQYYIVKYTGTGTGTVTITNQQMQVWLAGYANSTGRITGTGGMTITGNTVNLNASSNYAANIGTGSTTSTVTIGGASNGTSLLSPIITLSNGSTIKSALTEGTLLSGVKVSPLASTATGSITRHQLFSIGDVTGTTAFGMGDVTKPTNGIMGGFGRTAIATSGFTGFDTGLDIRAINKLANNAAYNLQGAYIKAKNYSGGTVGALRGLFIETVGDGTETSSVALKIGSDATAIDTGIDLDEAVVTKEIVFSNGTSYKTGAATTRAQVRADSGDALTVGSVYVSTAGKVYLKIANNTADADWVLVTTSAAD